MSSTLKAESARANGAKSHGPITPEGKAASSRNAVRHGLTGNFTVLPSESQDDFQILLDAYIDRFDPADPVEMELVQTMAITRWRLRRIGNLESGMLENEMSLSGEETGDPLAAAFRTLANQGKALSLLIRYEATLNRLYDRALKQLDDLQNQEEPNKPIQLIFRDPTATSTQSPIPPQPPEGKVQELWSRGAPYQPSFAGPCNRKRAVGTCNSPFVRL